MEISKKYLEKQKRRLKHKNDLINGYKKVPYWLFVTISAIFIVLGIVFCLALYNITAFVVIGGILISINTITLITSIAVWITFSVLTKKAKEQKVIIEKEIQEITIELEKINNNSNIANHTTAKDLK